MGNIIKYHTLFRSTGPERVILYPYTAERRDASRLEAVYGHSFRISLGMVHIIEYLHNLLCFSLLINNMGQGKTLMYVGIRLETFSRRIFVLPFSDSISDLFLVCRKLQVFLPLFALIVPFKSMTFLVPILIVLFIAAFIVSVSYKFSFSPFIQPVVGLAAGRLISLGLISRPLLSSSH